MWKDSVILFSLLLAALLLTANAWQKANGDYQNSWVEWCFYLNNGCVGGNFYNEQAGNINANNGAGNGNFRLRRGYQNIDAPIVASVGSYFGGDEIACANIKDKNTGLAIGWGTSNGIGNGLLN